MAGGVLLGIAGGLVLRQAVANGPEAIVGMYLKEKYDITVGTFFLVLNTVIIFSSILYGDLTLIIYSLISNYIASKVTDFVIVGTKRYYKSLKDESFVYVSESTGLLGGGFE